MNDLYEQKINIERKTHLVWKRVIQVKLRLVPGLSLISRCYEAPCSLFYMQNCQLTETKLGEFNKRVDELNISVKISKINLILAEKLTSFSARMCSFTWLSSPGMEDGLDTRA